MPGYVAVTAEPDKYGVRLPQEASPQIVVVLIGSSCLERGC